MKSIIITHTVEVTEGLQIIPLSSPKKSHKVDIKVGEPVKRNTGIQVTISNDPYPIVTHIQALTREELPAVYLKSYLPKVWLSEGKLFSELNQILLEKGDEKPYSRQEIAAALLHIRLAGEHLAAINKELHLKYRQAATFKDGIFKKCATFFCNGKTSYDKPY
ncbi:MAG: hypothetical protein IMF19_04580 [Proteobacteria bacterium]|nr:hypothetical protein [Pseudomonadota bacterium]